MVKPTDYGIYTVYKTVCIINGMEGNQISITNNT